MQLQKGKMFEVSFLQETHLPNSTMHMHTWIFDTVSCTISKVPTYKVTYPHVSTEHPTTSTSSTTSTSTQARPIHGRSDQVKLHHHLPIRETLSATCLTRFPRLAPSNRPEVSTTYRTTVQHPPDVRRIPCIHNTRHPQPPDRRHRRPFPRFRSLPQRRHHCTKTTPVQTTSPRHPSHPGLRQ